MANIFISYGDIKFKKSLAVIKKEAKKVGIFDKIILYTPEDLPDYIKTSPLFAFRKGGGYWVWKPYIIDKTLQLCKEGDVVYYADAGCTLNPFSTEWDTFKVEISRHNAIFFQYRSNIKYEGWDAFCSVPSNNSPKILHWMKPASIDYFTEFFGNQDFLKYNKIWGGGIIVKKTKSNLNVFDQWLKITLFRPDLVCDPFGKELAKIPETYNNHRHDQAILTPLIYKYCETDNILVIPETSESSKANAAIITSRRVIWTWNLYDKIIFKLKRIWGI